MPEDDFIIPMAGSARTIHRYLRNNSDRWFTLEELSRYTSLTEESIRTALTFVLIDPRVIRGKRPQPDSRSIDEYAFMPLLPFKRSRGPAVE